MGDPFLLAAVTALGLSGLVSAIRLIDWFLHSDPKVIAHTGRWAALGLAALSVPLLFTLLLAQRWTAAIGLAAVMLLGFAFYGPRLLRTLMPRRLVPDWSPPKAPPLPQGVPISPIPRWSSVRSPSWKSTCAARPASPSPVKRMDRG